MRIRAENRPSAGAVARRAASPTHSPRTQTHSIAPFPGAFARHDGAGLMIRQRSAIRIQNRAQEIERQADGVADDLLRDFELLG